MYTVYSNQLKTITYKYIHVHVHVHTRYMYMYMYVHKSNDIKTADKRVMMKSKLSKGLVC